MTESRACVDAGFRIAVSGKSGCGNTTVSSLVSERLGLRFINFTFRSLAAEHGIDLAEVLRRAKSDDYWDRTVDARQVALARADGGCVLGSRLAIWMLPEADLKVYLRATAATRVARIHRREGGDMAGIAAFTAARDHADQSRYRELYGIDTDDFAFADLVIDVDELDPEAIAGLIITAAVERCAAGRP
jgi:cytidylate kinase